jgi:hypothetical protein
MANNNPAQKIVDVLGTAGPMSGQDLKAQSGLDTESLKATVYSLIEQGIVTKDGNVFDVTLEFRADGRDDAQGAGEADEFEAPAKPAKPAATKVAPPKAAPAKAPAAKAPAPKAGPSETRSGKGGETGTRRG